MLEITIRDLHMKTGDWVRRAAQADGIIVLERGKPVAKIVPFQEEDQGTPFGDRSFVAEFLALPKIDHDSGQYISEDRDRG